MSRLLVANISCKKSTPFLQLEREIRDIKNWEKEKSNEECCHQNIINKFEAKRKKNNEFIRWKKRDIGCIDEYSNEKIKKNKKREKLFGCGREKEMERYGKRERERERSKT